MCIYIKHSQTFKWVLIVKHELKMSLFKKAQTDIKYFILCILCKPFLNNDKTSTSQN